MSSFDEFLSFYNLEIKIRAVKVRNLIFEILPDITEQVDLHAKMVAYSYGPKYSDMICVIIPSKKGLKLGFSRGAVLADPNHLLEGKGKLSRYLEISNLEMIDSNAIPALLRSSLDFYKKKTK